MRLKDRESLRRSSFNPKFTGSYKQKSAPKMCLIAIKQKVVYIAKVLHETEKTESIKMDTVVYCIMFVYLRKTAP